MNGESLWSRLAAVALIVEGCEYSSAVRDSNSLEVFEHPFAYAQAAA
jgi:hypothetical protein